MDALRTAWPHIRALLVLLHCVAIFVMAIPAPGGGMSKSAWQDPTVQGEFAAWTQRLNGWGWQGTQAELEDELWDLSVNYMAGRAAVLAPFRPYYRYTGTGQSWRMFVAPHRYPARLHIDVKERGEWRPIYIGRSREYAWRARVFDFDRLRSATFRYAWRPYRRQYYQFVKWVVGEVREDFPEAEAVRTRFYKYRTPSPDEVRTGTQPEGRFVLTREVKLK